MPARRARYRVARRAVLAVGLFVGIGYPLVIALGGAVLVQLHTGARGTTLTVHNARPWLIIAAVAAVLLVLEWITPAPAPAPTPDAPSPSPPLPPADSAASREQALEARIDDLRAARRSEQEFNAALDAQLAGLWRDSLPTPDRRSLADGLLELTMELVDAPMGLLVLGHDAQGAVAARGVADPADLVGQFADGRPVSSIAHRYDRAGGDWLVLALPGDPGGYVALGGRSGGFAGLDDDALSGVAARLAYLLSRPPAGPAPIT